MDGDDQRDIVERLREAGRRARSQRDQATISEAVGAILGLRAIVRERTKQLLDARYPAISEEMRDG